MIIVTLENDKNTLRTELPKPLDDLIDDLGSIGITEPMNNITLSKDSPYNIRLYSDSVLGQAVIERLTGRDDLAALNSLCGQLYKGFDDTFKAEIINESNANGVHDLRTLFGIARVRGSVLLYDHSKGKPRKNRRKYSSKKFFEKQKDL